MQREISWRKRRLVAPFLSAVVPGLGQAFTARWGVATTFFLFALAPSFFAAVIYFPRYIESLKDAGPWTIIGLLSFIRHEINVGHYIMFGFLLIVWIIGVVDAWRGTTRPSAPCMEACPAHIEIPSYINLLLEGRMVEAHDIVTRKTPLVATIGYVCHHPCEKKCTRQTFDEPVAICPLKAVIGTHMIEGNLLKDVPKPPTRTTAPRVAIIGSGPAGLSAGFFLSRLGMQPTIFEALPVAGGMLAVGIPSYRLPRRILQAEINFIKDQGVAIKTGLAVGKDVSLDDIFSEGFRAVFAAPGTHREAKLRLEGEDKEGVAAGLEFLRNVNLGTLGFLEGAAVVVGGGNVAMDAARCALRLGASPVTVVYRRSRREMPANDWEVEEAEEEGIHFLFLTNPTRILGVDRLEGVECQEMKLGEPDASGRRRPIPVPGSEFTIPCRYLIPAIGLVPETSFLEKSGAKLDPNGLILVNGKRMMTSRTNLFAGGDAVTGASSVIEASTQGREAAIRIYQHLSGGGRFRFAPHRIGRPQSEFASQSRVPQQSRIPGDRRKDFSLIHQVYDEKSFLSEGRRCLRCDHNI